MVSPNNVKEEMRCGVVRWVTACCGMGPHSAKKPKLAKELMKIPTQNQESSLFARQSCRARARQDLFIHPLCTRAKPWIATGEE